MGNKNIHTVPAGNKWAVKKEGSKEPISTHKLKVNAMQKAVVVAKKDHVEHVIHGKDGKIQDKDSYGKDPNPPKDKRH
jgi:hypothetical protein